MRDQQVAGFVPRRHPRADRTTGATRTARTARTARTLSARAWAIAAVALGALAFVGCASNGSRRGQADLTSLQLALPGVYTGGVASTGAAAAGAGTEAAGAAGSSAVTLSIRPITAQVLGDAVYFVRETPADNSSLVLAQGIWTFEVGKARDRAHDKSAGGPAILQHRFLFKEPRRWVGAAENPDLLQSILPEDLQALPGCDLLWHKTSTGFETGTEPQSCQPGSAAQGLWIEQHAQLQGKQLSLVERRTGADGALDTSGPPLSLQLARTSGG